MTPHEFLALRNNESMELIDGQMREIRHSEKSAATVERIRHVLASQTKGKGIVMPRGILYTSSRRDLKCVLRPDISYFAADRLPSLEGARSLNAVPDLVVEVVSPNDLAYDLDGTTNAWREMGVECVLVVCNALSRVRCYRAKRVIEEYSGDQIVKLDWLVPKFEFSVADFFRDNSTTLNEGVESEVSASSRHVSTEETPKPLSTAEHIAIEEERIVNLVREILIDRNFEDDYRVDSPMYRLCLRLEYRTVNMLFARLRDQKIVDEWIDGFIPKCVEVVANVGIKIAGRCWCGRASVCSQIEGPFQATICLTPDMSQLAVFDLCFADAIKMTTERVIAEESPDVTIDDVEGYRIIVQKSDAVNGGSDRKWAFQITRQHGKGG